MRAAPDAAGGTQRILGWAWQKLGRTDPLHRWAIAAYEYRIEEAISAAHGSQLTAGAAVRLVPGSGSPIAATKVVLKDSSTLYATFDLTGRPAGTRRSPHHARRPTFLNWTQS